MFIISPFAQIYLTDHGVIINVRLQQNIQTIT